MIFLQSVIFHDQTSSIHTPFSNSKDYLHDSYRQNLPFSSQSKTFGRRSNSHWRGQAWGLSGLPSMEVSSWTEPNGPSAFYIVVGSLLQCESRNRIHFIHLTPTLPYYLLIKCTEMYSSRYSPCSFEANQVYLILCTSLNLLSHHAKPDDLAPKTTPAESSPTAAPTFLYIPVQCSSSDSSPWYTWSYKL